jgi:VanZ family protein
MRTTKSTRPQPQTRTPPGIAGAAVRAFTRWVPAILWVGLVLALGASIFSIARTSTIFDPLLERISPGLGQQGLYNLQVFIRRSAHFTEYAILFVFLNLGPLRGRPAIALIVAIGCGSLDETRQLFTPGRSGTVSDVALDASGATTMLVLAMPYWDRLRHHRQSLARQKN